MNRNLPDSLDIKLRNRVMAHCDLTQLSDSDLEYALWYGLRQIIIDNRHFADRDPTFAKLSESVAKGKGA